MENEEKQKRRNTAQFDLSDEARRLLRELADKSGISMTAWLEVNIRQAWQNKKEINSDGA